MNMLTWKEFERKNADKAFEIATRICQQQRAQAQKDFPHSAALLYASDIVSEQHLILSEWWDDYRHEHV